MKHLLVKTVSINDIQTISIIYRQISAEKQQQQQQQFCLHSNLHRWYCAKTVKEIRNHTILK